MQLILSFISCGYETCYFTLKEEHRLRVFENTMLRRIFGFNRGKIKEDRENYIMRNLIIVTVQILLE
jgi:hypothetical protein